MISFTVSDEQQMVVDTVRRYATERLRAHAHDADEARATPPDLIVKGWDLGLLPASIPEQYGGFGESHSAVSGVLAAEELAYGDPAMALYLMTPNLFALPILHCGTEEQKEKWLPRVIEGGFAPYTAALIEPRWNFDVHALHTTAEREGDYYELNGHKTYVPLAADAQSFLIYAREGDTTQAFLVDRTTEGLTILERENHMGIRALPTYGLRLEDCHVLASCRLGGDQGSQIDLLMNYSRVGLAALSLGTARAAYEYARDYAKTRETFGRPIAQYQSIAFMLAEMAIEIESSRGLTLEAAWQLDKAKDATKETVLAKQYADDMVLFVTDRAVQVLGGHGYIREHPVERWLRDGRGFAAFLGMAMV